MLHGADIKNCPVLRMYSVVCSFKSKVYMSAAYTVGFSSYVAFSILDCANYRIILEVDPVIIVQRAAVKTEENPFSEQSVAQVRLPSDYL